jgi:hypothetical protein
VVAGSHDYAAGEFLTTPPGPAAPEGFLLKVVSSRPGGVKTEVLTEPASFYEAVPNGEIDEDLSESDGAVPLDAAASRMEASASGISQLFSRHVSCSDGAQAELSGSLEGGLDPRLELKWHKHFGIPTGIDKARVALEAGIEAEVSATVSAKSSCKLSPVTLFTPKWEVPVDVGPVVVPVKVEIPVSLIASAEVDGKVSLSAEADVNGAIGAAYEEGGIHGVHEFSTGHKLTDTISANAKLRVGLNPEIKIKAGWSVPVLGTLGAEVDAGITAGPELNYDSTRKPPGTYCAFLDVDSSIALDLPHEDPIEDGPHTWYDGDLGCIVFGPEERGDGKPEVKRETGEKELGERKGKDGGQEFEEEREREEEKTLEEEVEQEVKEREQEERKNEEEEERERHRAELETLEADYPGDGLLKWTGQIVGSNSSDSTSDYYRTGTSYQYGTFEVNGYTVENLYREDTNTPYLGMGATASEVNTEGTTVYTHPTCAHEGSYGKGLGDGPTVLGFQFSRGLPIFDGILYSPADTGIIEEWVCHGKVVEEHVESWRPAEDAQVEFFDADCEQAPQLVAPGTVFENVAMDGHDYEDPLDTFTCALLVELTARCREPGKPESQWPAPNELFECPESKH